MKLPSRLVFALLVASLMSAGVFSFLHEGQPRSPGATFLAYFALSLFLVLVTAAAVRWSMTGPIQQMAEWLKALRTGSPRLEKELPSGDLLGPLASEAASLAKSLVEARESAHEEARLRLTGEALWTAERLKEHLRLELGKKSLYVLSNREPYEHVRQGRGIEWKVPPGGLVAALDPVLQACGGVWIAHGSGDADREMSDGSGRLGVPPDAPVYTLRRIWLTEDEEQGYYYGFSNEGLWPLCHIVHTRPVFRLQDWNQYQKVNEKFAAMLLEEVADEEKPLVLVQDYHLALVPLYIKARRPDARVAIFWHIPWPNPEAFGICPWKEKILEGLLNADLIGFHVQFHCHNFLDTVDRFLESRISREEFSVERRGHTTFVRPFPISVAFPGFAEHQASRLSPPNADPPEFFKELGSRPRYLGVGVDRLDYTKGILERFYAIERFFEKYPQFLEQFTFLELGAPSRTELKRYQDLIGEIEAQVERINGRFQTRTWKPILFEKSQHKHATINTVYGMADLCMVTSLHDGMNLVAKEFVASRDDEQGVLILSEFTGASRELQDALLVNPYDIEGMAEVIYQALTMPTEEQAERMRRLRMQVRERNVFRWAANLVTVLARLRVEESVQVRVERS